MSELTGKRKKEGEKLGSNKRAKVQLDDEDEDSDEDEDEEENHVNIFWFILVGEDLKT